MLPSIKTILLATDMGPQADNVLRHAEAMAVARGAGILILHVIEPIPPHAASVISEFMSSEAAADMRRAGIDALRGDVEKQVQAFFEAESASGVTSGSGMPEIRILEGSPAPAIIAEASRVGADLIVMGTHGYSTLGEIVLGSVAHKVISKTTVPVYLVPYRGQAKS